MNKVTESKVTKKGPVGRSKRNALQKANAKKTSVPRKEKTSERTPYEKFREEVLKVVKGVPGLPEDLKPENITQVEIGIEPTPQTPEEKLYLLEKKCEHAITQAQKYEEWFDKVGMPDDIETLIDLMRGVVEQGLIPLDAPAVKKIVNFARDKNVIKSSRSLIQAHVDFFFEPCNPPGISNEEMATRIVEKMKYGENSDFAYCVGTPVIVGETKEVTKVEVLG